MQRCVKVNRKVFGLGVSKNGTTSLQYALAILGYRSRGGVDDYMRPGRTLFERCVNVIDEGWEAFFDEPWPRLYVEIGRKYPGSLFILSKRNEEDWFSSMLTQNRCVRSGYTAEMYDWPMELMDVPKERILYHYREHNKAVEEYFEGRDDFLVMNMPGDFRWEVLCKFLGKDIPQKPFPHGKPTT